MPSAGSYSPPLAFTFGLGGMLMFPMWAGASVYFPDVAYTPEAIESASTLELLVSTGVYVAHDPATKALIKRIVASMDASDFTSGEMLKASNQVWTQTTW